MSTIVEALEGVVLVTVVAGGAGFAGGSLTGSLLTGADPPASLAGGLLAWDLSSARNPVQTSTFSPTRAMTAAARTENPILLSKRALIRNAFNA